MNEDIFGVIILITLIGFIGYFYFKNKKENKDDYTEFNDGSGNIPGWNTWNPLKLQIYKS